MSNSKFGALILGNSVSVYIGKISFSLYMLHMPILVYGNRIFSIDGEFISIYIILIFALSALSYEFFEKKARFHNLTPKKTYLYYLVFPTVFFGTIFTTISIKNGIPERFDLTNEMTMISTIKCDRLSEDCYIGDVTSSNQVLLIGDSHARALSHFFNKIGTEQNIKIRDFQFATAHSIQTSLGIIIVKNIKPGYQE